MTEKQHSKLRFFESMPKPVMLVFAIFVVAAVVVTVLAIAVPQGETVALEERRPPPRGTLSHDTGLIAPAPLGSIVPTLPPACDVVRTTKLIASGNGVLRLRRVLQQVCQLERGASADATDAVRALGGVTVRFGGFARTGVESTVDFAARTIWLNIKYSIQSKPIEELTPVLMHDAFHLARASAPIDAEQELRARGVEATVCEILIPVAKWPRSCRDARALGRLPEVKAIELLARAGYAR